MLYSEQSCLYISESDSFHIRRFWPYGISMRITLSTRSLGDLMVVRHTTRTASEANRCGKLRTDGFARETASAVPPLAANCCGQRVATGRHLTSSHGRPARAEGRVGASGFPRANAERSASYTASITTPSAELS